jgi:glycosyltransferase involved in cell wall biosynthesis
MHGGAQRTSHILRAMQSLGDVDIALVGTPKEATPAVALAKADGLHVICSFPRDFLSYPPDSLLHRLPGIGPIARTIDTHLGVYTEDEEIASWLRRSISRLRYDAVVCRFLRPALLGGLSREIGAPLILDWDDVDYLKFASMLSATPWPGIRGRITSVLVKLLIRAKCNRALGLFDHVWIVSRPEDLARKPKSFSLLPNIPWNADSINATPPAHATSSQQILFVGNLRYTPNRDALLRFIRHVWPRIRSACPSATIVAVGQLPDDSTYDDIKDVNGITLTGLVPSLESYYSTSAISVCPVEYGGGSNIKAVESIAHGVPCAMSPYSYAPFQHAFDESAGMICARTNDSFADACTQLLLDGARRQKIGLAGKKVVRQLYSEVEFDRRVSEDVREVLHKRNRQGRDPAE